MATEGDIMPVLNYKLGVKTKFLMNDLRALFSYLKHSNNRVQILKDFSKLDRICDDVISYDDVLPTIFFAYTNVKELFRWNRKA